MIIAYSYNKYKRLFENYSFFIFFFISDQTPFSAYYGTWECLTQICSYVILRHFLREVSIEDYLQMTIEYHHYQVLFLGYRETVSMQGRCATTPLLQGRAITLWVQKEGGTFNVR